MPPWLCTRRAAHRGTAGYRVRRIQNAPVIPVQALRPRIPKSSATTSGRWLGTGEEGVTIEQIAANFGVHPMTLTKWMRRADVDEGTKNSQNTSDSVELRELRRRNRLLEQENEVLRRAAAYLSQANLLGNASTRL